MLRRGFPSLLPVFVHFVLYLNEMAWSSPALFDKKMKKNTSRQKKIYLLGGYCFLIRIWPGFWVTMTSDCFCINCNLIGHVLMCWFTCEQPQLMKIRKPTRHWLLSKEHDIGQQRTKYSHVCGNGIIAIFSTF